MVLPFLRHKRVHDLLHRFSQIVRATGSHGRYCPCFHSRRRYTVRKKDSFEIVFVKVSREEEILHSIIIEEHLIYFKKDKKRYSYIPFLRNRIHLDRCRFHERWLAMLQKVRFCDNKREQIKHLHGLYVVADFAISLLCFT